MSSLKKHEMEAFLADENRKRNRELCEGYRHALDPKPFVEKLKIDRAALAEELKEREQNAEVDQLESEPYDEQDDDSRTGKKSKATTSKKRKRESDVEPKQKKGPKAKKESTEPNKKKSAAGKGRKNGVKSKALVESEDEGDNAEEDADDDGGVGTSKRTSPPPAKKSKRDKDDGDDCDFLSLSFFWMFSKVFAFSQWNTPQTPKLIKFEIGDTNFRKYSSATKLCPSLRFVHRYIVIVI